MIKKTCTKNGVYYDLKHSPYRIGFGKGLLPYANNNMPAQVVFAFSSLLNITRFKKKLPEYRRAISHSLTNRFGFAVTVPLIAYISLYKTIEKRGFLIFTEEGEITCLKEIALSGGKLMKIQLEEPQTPLTEK